MTDVLVIGGGVAGLFAAMGAAEQGHTVAVLERGRKPLKKLGVTGNGRGNLLNLAGLDYHGDEDFAREVFRHLSPKEVARLWESLGVPLIQEEEGRMYPSSLLAASAVEALMLRAKQLPITFHTAFQAKGITRTADGFRVEGLRTLYAPDTLRKSGKAKPGAALGQEPLSFEGRRVIVAAGGAASAMHLTDGSAYGLLTDFGHRLITPRPALCALLTETGPIAGLEGQRVRAMLTLTSEKGEAIAQSSGEALFAQDGISGIAAMQLSRFAQKGCILRMNLSPAVTGRLLTQMEAADWLRQRMQSRAGLPASQLLVGAATPALSAALMKACAGSLTAESLSHALCGFSLKVLSTRGFEAAQVTAGGIAPADFDPSTMESRLCPGLYAAGEVLDVDGACGGYNLMFAAATGYLAGRSTHLSPNML